jgi:hypothetical protein
MVRNTARTVQEMDPTPFGRALGWFSIGLGLAEALAPKTMAKAIGAEGYEGVVCAFGLREIATGIGILSGERPAAGWLWARVGGDALDLAFLGMAAACNRDNGGRVAIAAAAVGGVAMADLLCAQRLAEEEAFRPGERKG